MIRLTCPSCKTNFKAPDEAAGKATKCPECAGRITVPLPKIPEAKPDQAALRVIWTVCALWSLAIFVLGVVVIGVKAKNVIQEIAIAAVVCMNVLCMYVTMRAIDFIVRLGKSKRLERVGVGIALVITAVIFMFVAHAALKDVGNKDAEILPGLPGLRDR